MPRRVFPIALAEAFGRGADIAHAKMSFAAGYTFVCLFLGGLCHGKIAYWEIQWL